MKTFCCNRTKFLQLLFFLQKGQRVYFSDNTQRKVENQPKTTPNPKFDPLFNYGVLMKTFLEKYGEDVDGHP